MELHSRIRCMSEKYITVFRLLFFYYTIIVYNHTQNHNVFVLQIISRERERLYTSPKCEKEKKKVQISK